MLKKLYSYAGKIAKIDLSKRKVVLEETPKEYLKNYIGGSGLAARILRNKISKETNPLGSENVLLFMTGPLTGTPAPSCGRYCVCSKSPLTSIWGESNSGGKFGPFLKFAGYDGVYIKGRADKLVYLSIIDGEIEIRNAGYLKGMNTYETQKVLTEEIGLKNLSIACIGLAGENLVKYASIMNDGGRAAGRTGMGAVMGAKNLKAVIVSGHKEMKLAKPKKFKEVVEKAVEEIKENLLTSLYYNVGTAGGVDMLQELGDMPNKYFTEGIFSEASKISGAEISEKILVRNQHCYGCPIGCGKIIKIPKGRYKLPETDGPEYETVAAFGSLILNNSLEGLAYANYLCNSYGLDTISCGSTIAFAIYLYQQNKLSKEETEGLELEWGNIGQVIELIKLIAERKGFGKILAEGSRYIAEKKGLKGFAAEVKGLEVPYHDPRAFFGMAICYATSPRGACHLQGDMYLIDLGQEIPELNIFSGDRFNLKGRIETVIKAQNWRSIYNSLIMCQFSNPNPKLIVSMLNYATGFSYSLKGLLSAGSKIFNLKRLINFNLGISAKDDYLPEIFKQPLQGGTQGKTPKIEEHLKNYYRLRKWDPKTGKPLEEQP